MENTSYNLLIFMKYFVPEISTDHYGCAYPKPLIVFVNYYCKKQDGCKNLMAEESDQYLVIY